MTEPTLQLDPIREDILSWAASLWLEEPGAFRDGASEEPSLQASLFLCYILYSIDGLDAFEHRRGQWVQWIQAQQSEQDGSFSFSPAIGSARPRKGIALWNAVRGLNILGAQIERLPRYQRSTHTVEGLRDWFETWKAWGDSHHEVLALVPTLECHPDEAWGDAFFDELADQQHPMLGYWLKGDKPPNISRTFAYSLIHIGMGRLPPQPDRIVDTMLDLQGADGFWNGALGYSTMDAIFLLGRLPEAISYREGDAEGVLNRTLDVLIPFYETEANRIREHIHPFAAMVQSLALLYEALPDRFATSRPWRFSWANRAIWRCEAIAEVLSDY